MTAVVIIKERERKSPRSCMSRQNGKEYFVQNGNMSLNGSNINVEPCFVSSSKRKSNIPSEKNRFSCDI